MTNWYHVDLFSGIGGFSLAAQWVWGRDHEIVLFCEIDPFCQRVLNHHWPSTPIIADVREVDEEIIRTYSKGNDIDLLTGGFPCQPFSVAGKRRGRRDDRFLWPDMFRIIRKVRPRWIVAENVAGIVRMALDDCLSDLEGEGYSTQAVIIPACAVNAPHRRDRVWIVAHAEEQGGNDTFRIGISGWGKSRQGESQTNGWQQRRGSDAWWSTEPDVGRVAHGIPSRVDRLKSLGNAIVPQVAYQILRGIRYIEEGKEVL